MIADLHTIKAEIVAAVRVAVRDEMKREQSSLLTVPETARRFRMRDDEVRQAARDGRVKCCRRSRGGGECFMIDVKDAERQWGAK